ncbi:ABC transporter permease [Paracoccus sp. S1E-3]|uniref:ABC transporter permease n=1 Tax=Paracoccus sp. S1E-3 TaxID=2756130 RepID=UPI0015EF632E|nr:ABC transporter permease [Paracoccus sp. S1E-3]MBA4491483.1 ABC transporter permease [Paracoccus sp. S1E-3]
MNFEIIINALPKLFDGLGVTLTLTAITVVLGLLIAVPLAIARSSGPAWLNAIVFAYTFFFRGTPLLVQLYLVYYGSGQFRPQLEAANLWWFFRDPWNCAILTFTLSTAAYTTEIIRGAILAVPTGQREAAKAYGMTPFQRTRMVILPQAFSYAIPTYMNEIVFQLQATALVSLITIPDLTGVATVIANRTYAHYELYLTAALFYLVVVYALLLVLKQVERRLTHHMTV